MTETVGALQMLLAAHRHESSDVGAVGSSGSAQRVPRWWLHQIVLGDLVVGDAGFHAPPAHGSAVEVEIGYNVVAGLRGNGIAGRACGLLVARAWRDGATMVRAETDAANLASQRVLLRAGFTGDALCRYQLGRPARGRAR